MTEHDAAVSFMATPSQSHQPDPRMRIDESMQASRADFIEKLEEERERLHPRSAFGELQIRAAATPFPILPEHLWQIIPVLVPGDAEHESDTMGWIEMPSTEEIMNVHSLDAIPSFTGVRVPVLADDQLLEAWNYATAYKAHIATKAAMCIALADRFQMDAKAYRSFLVTLYYLVDDKTGKAVVPMTVVKAYVDVDPYLRELQVRTSTVTAIAKYMTVEVEKLDTFLNLCSRSMTNTHAHMQSMGRNVPTAEREMYNKANDALNRYGSRDHYGRRRR